MAEQQPEIHCLFEHTTRTWQYIVADPSTRRAVIIDPVLDRQQPNDSISTVAADNILRLVQHYGYVIERILQTHTHSNAPSAIWYLRAQLRDLGHDPRIAISSSTDGLRRLFQRKYGMQDPGFTGAFDGEYTDADSFRIGGLVMHCMRLPGHTPNQLGYLCGHNIFAGGAVPNVDSIHEGVDDFPTTEPERQQYQASMDRILRLPPHFRVYKGHDDIKATKKGQEARIALAPFATVQAHRREGVESDRGVVELPNTPVTTEKVASNFFPKPWTRRRGSSLSLKSKRRVAFAELEHAELATETL